MPDQKPKLPFYKPTFIDKMEKALGGQPAKNEGSTPPAPPQGNERTYKEGTKETTQKKSWWPF